jgi:hypothetical protein
MMRTDRARAISDKLVTDGNELENCGFSTGW